MRGRLRSVRIVAALVVLLGCLSSTSWVDHTQTEKVASGPAATTPLSGMTLGSQSEPACPSAPAPEEVAAPDYPQARWIPAAAGNFSVANRPHDCPVDMIVIHDTEVPIAQAVRIFQDPIMQRSANYIVSASGQIVQMVHETDIAWHAGNWDYNTRAIGIEHEGYAWTPGSFSKAEYQASAHLAASICSRWGVPMDRTHVIGHFQVPDDHHPGLFGGESHRTDPGPYWDWSYYLSLAASDARALPSPPRMMVDPVAVNGLDSATVTWQPARSCRLPILGYTSVLRDSPQSYGGKVLLHGAATGCRIPRYAFALLSPGSGTWTLARPYSSAPVFYWRTTGYASGTYSIRLMVRDARGPGTYSSVLGSYDGYLDAIYTVTATPNSSVAVSPEFIRRFSA
ncbi:MAG: N-acetylmuramoyl-L-alanine amidase [Chloroflexi bacterium]|nr:MAG: N-acetylmuramoyl-L-alanine amidase [Chloroflexota bacterium]